MVREGTSGKSRSKGSSSSGIVPPLCGVQSMVMVTGELCCAVNVRIFVAEL